MKCLTLHYVPSTQKHEEKLTLDHGPSVYFNSLSLMRVLGLGLFVSQIWFFRLESFFSQVEHTSYKTWTMFLKCHHLTLRGFEKLDDWRWHSGNAIPTYFWLIRQAKMWSFMDVLAAEALPSSLGISANNKSRANSSRSVTIFFPKQCKQQHIYHCVFTHFLSDPYCWHFKVKHWL